MSIIEKNMMLIELYDLYQDLLTDKQKSYFESYYFEDFSISEISENEDVSRNAVHDQIKRTEQKLITTEEKLQLRAKQKIRSSLIDKLETICDSDEARELIEELKKVE